MPIINDLSIKIGGEAGQGVESSGAGFAKALARAGLWIYGLQDYMSRIRGGHNFYQVRVSDHELWTFRDAVHMLLPLTTEAVERHWREIVPGGAVLYDVGLKFDEAPLRERGIKLFAMPLMKIAEQQGGNRIMMNTAALGAVAGITEFDFAYIADIIETNFKRKGAAVVESNLKVARYAYDAGQEQFAADFDWKLVARPGPKRMVINGNQALALGAIAAGCRFISGYPMTPATSILEYMNAKARQFGIVTKQTEDEIAALLMAIGAAHAGVRAMTATSGGGFCLMTEALGFAGCTETPVVIVDAQRAGPSTGLPTRTEQGDLEFVLHASHGEFPRIVLTPGTIEECFYAGARAFNLAEKYQCPVIIMQDLTQSNSIRAIDLDRFDFASIRIDRGALLTPEELDRLPDGYRRHLVTPDGISPRAVPGHPKAVYVTTGDEHTDQGYITEEADIRRAQMDKRMRKLETARAEMRLPVRYGPQDAELTFVGWGSTYGAIREAVDILNAAGTRANQLHFMEVWPLDWERVRALLDEARSLVLVEQNYSGQLGNVLRTYTGKTMDKKILKYDGRPISPDEIVAGVRGEVREEVRVYA
ncbi:MAG TPA: 2-oxoacid:acceptor oxidoreductase subunit alpha [Chloroflexota bacterium]|nr:2-oxoacid:acceptor oxidoreductase subunit alpha [Chloroflexota bacterium]